MSLPATLLWHASSLDSDYDYDDVTTEATVRGKGWPLQCAIYESGMQTHKDPVRLAPQV